MTLPISLFIASFLFVSNAQAAETKVYKTTNKDGQVEFTDKPNPSAEKVIIPPMNTYNQKPLPPTTAKSKPKEAQANYSNFVINSPANDSQVRSNSGNVTIIIGFEPPLKAGHSIKVVISGSSQTTKIGKSSNIFFKNVNPGTHNVQAFIIDANDNVLADSNTSIFHLLRYTYNRAPARPSIGLPISPPITLPITPK